MDENKIIDLALQLRNNRDTQYNLELEIEKLEDSLGNYQAMLLEYKQAEKELKESFSKSLTGKE